MSKQSIFSQNLIKARKQRGWSQEGAAASIGIKRSKLKNYELGVCEPPLRILLRICSVYEIKDLEAFCSSENYEKIAA